jgi:large subunit ribosomal protein L31
MKKGLHPDYKTLTVTLTDDTVMETRSTLKADTYKTEVDAKNHPFYTGKRQFVDTAGRVEKFRRRYGDTSKKAAETEESGDAAQ